MSEEGSGPLCVGDPGGRLSLTICSWGLSAVPLRCPSLLLPLSAIPLSLALKPCLPPLFVGRRQDGFVVQTGDPEGPDEGFRDPKTGEIRT